MANSTQQLLDIVNALTETQSRSESRLSSAVPVPVTIQRPDPTRITSYREALKYFVKYLGTSDAIIAVVGAMIREQEEKEAQWLENREQLRQRQKKARGSKEKMNSLLNMVTNSHGQDGLSSLTADKTELDSLDRRIYDDFQQLAKKYQHKLRELQMPLFCISDEITRVYSKEQVTALSLDQHKFLQFLVDLCI